MSINLFNVLKEMDKMTRSCYEEYPDGTFGIKMPTWEDIEESNSQADSVYDEWKAKETNKEDSKC